MRALFFILAIFAALAGAYALFPRDAEAPAPESVPVKLYYYDPAKDIDEAGNVMCSRRGLVAVDRAVPASSAIEQAIRLLIRGELSAAERERGITTEFPLAGFALEDASLENGVLTLAFDDPEHRTVGGSCRAAILWAQIEETAKQFPGVASVRFAPEELFQP